MTFKKKTIHIKTVVKLFNFAYEIWKNMKKNI